MKQEAGVQDSMTRRSVLSGAATAGALAGAAPFSLAAAADAQPAPRPPRTEWIYDAVVLLQKEIPHGQTIRGKRFRVPIIGGDFSGPSIRGKIIPGGFDWQLLRSDGYWEIQAEYFMETHDGAQIHVLNRGLWHSPNGDWPADYNISTPQFEAPDGPYAWMNQFIFTGTIGPAGTAEAPGVKLSIFRLTTG